MSGCNVYLLKCDKWIFHGSMNELLLIFGPIFTTHMLTILRFVFCELFTYSH